MTFSRRRPRSQLVPLLVATLAVIAISSTGCLTWQAPLPLQGGVSSRRFCRDGDFMCRPPTTRYRRPREAVTAAADDSGVYPGDARGDLAGHDAFVEGLIALTGDPLEQEGGRIVVFRGNPRARLMLIGEAPGAEEDKLGVPFVGPSGQLLDDILKAVGLDPERDVYVSNIVRRRPINNRTPTPDEMDFYLPILLEEIRLVDPDVIVTLGASSTRALLPFETRGITKARGRWVDPEDLASVHGGALERKLIMPWFHPSYLIRNAGERSRLEGGVRWHTRNDLREVKRALLCVQGALHDPKYDPYR